MKVTLTCQGDKIRLIGSETRLICRARCEERRALRQAMAKAGLEEVRFHFDFEGTKVIIQ